MTTENRFESSAESADSASSVSLTEPSSPSDSSPDTSLQTSQPDSQEPSPEATVTHFEGKEDDSEEILASLVAEVRKSTPLQTSLTPQTTSRGSFSASGGLGSPFFSSSRRQPRVSQLLFLPPALSSVEERGGIAAAAAHAASESDLEMTPVSPMPSSASAARVEAKKERTVVGSPKLPLSPSQVRLQKAYDAAHRAVEKNNPALLRCFLQPQCDDVVQRYQAGLAFEDVNNYTLSKQNKKERLVLEELNRFFQKHKSVAQYKKEDLQKLVILLGKELVQEDIASLKDVETFLQARASFAVDNHVFKIQEEAEEEEVVISPGPGTKKRAKAENDKNRLSVDDFQKYTTHHRPLFDPITPEKLGELGRKILSLDTPHKLRRYMQTLRVQIFHLKRAEVMAGARLSSVGLDLESYKQEEYAKACIRQIQEKEAHIQAFLNTDESSMLLGVLECQSVEEAYELLVSQYDFCPIEEAEQSEGRKRNTLYVGIKKMMDPEAENKDEQEYHLVLEYRVYNPKGEWVCGLISQNELLTYQISSPLRLDVLKIYLGDILEVTSTRGDTLPPPAQVSAFVQPATIRQQHSLFAYAQAVGATEIYAVLRPQYDALKTYYPDKETLEREVRVQMRLSCQDIYKVDTLRELTTFFYQPVEKADAVLRDRMLALWYAALTYLISGEEPDKARYINVYKHKKITVSDKQKILMRLLQEEGSHPHLSELFEAHAFEEVKYVQEIPTACKLRMACVLKRDGTTEKLLDELFLLGDSNELFMEGDRKVLRCVLQDSSLSNVVKQKALDVYLDCYGERYGARHVDFRYIEDLAARSYTVQQLCFYLRKKLCMVLERKKVYVGAMWKKGISVDKTVLEAVGLLRHDPLLRKYLDALCMVQSCNMEEIIAQIQQYHILGMELKNHTHLLPAPIQNALHTALLQADRTQSFGLIESFVDQRIALPPGLYAPLRRHFYAHIEGEWIYFMRKKMHAEGESGFHALADMLQIRSVQRMRNLFATWVLENKDTPALKAALLEEIRTIVYAEQSVRRGLQIKGAEVLHETYHQHYQHLKNALQFVRTTHEASLPEGLTDAELMAYMRAHPNAYQVHLPVCLPLEEKVIISAREITAFCEREEVIAEYIAGLQDYRWLGAHTAVLFAAAYGDGVALTILGSDIKVVAASPSADGQVYPKKVYLLLTEGRYDRLIEKERFLDPLLEAAKESKEEEEHSDQKDEEVASASLRRLGETEQERQWLVLFFYLSCVMYLYAEVSGGPPAEKYRLERARIHYFLEYTKKNLKHYPTIAVPVIFIFLMRPIFFAYNRPEVIGMEHTGLLDMLRVHIQGEEVIISDSSPEIDPMLLSAQIGKGIEKYVSTLGEKARQYEKAFKELAKQRVYLEQYEVSARTAWVRAYYENRIQVKKQAIEGLVRQIAALQEDHPTEVVPRDMQRVEQFDALLRIKERLERLQKTKGSDVIRKAAELEAYHRGSMTQDVVTLLESARQKSEKSEAKKEVDRTLMIACESKLVSLPEGSPPALTEEARHGVLNDFYSVFCAEMKRIIAFPQETKRRLEVIIATSNTTKLDVDRLKNLAERIEELGAALFGEEALLPSAEAIEFISPAQDVSVKQQAAIEHLALPLLHFFQKQIALIEVPHYTKFAGFLAEMIFLYTCSEKMDSPISLVDLIVWLDRGPVLYVPSGILQKPKIWQGPKIMIATVAEPIHALELVRLSGLRCVMQSAPEGDSQELCYVLEARESLPHVCRSKPKIYGYKTVFLPAQITDLEFALLHQGSHNRWYTYTEQPFFIDLDAVKQHKKENVYTPFKEWFVPKKEGLKEVLSNALKSVRAEMEQREAGHKAALQRQQEEYAAELERQRRETVNALERQKIETASALEQQKREMREEMARLAQMFASMQSRGGTPTQSPSFLGRTLGRGSASPRPPSPPGPAAGGFSPRLNLAGPAVRPPSPPTASLQEWPAQTPLRQAGPDRERPGSSSNLPSMKDPALR